jgi:site-specific DNA-methyltransferase (cytosine-N4-specific)
MSAAIAGNRSGSQPPPQGSEQEITLAYSTKRGAMYRGKAEVALASPQFKKYYGKVQMIFTSPPFPLNRKKKYGNLKGDAYIDWLASFAPMFRKFLKKDGSIVMEVGNAWEPGKPVMSTLALRALLAFLDRGNFNLCQQFVVYNPARLPSPAQWVNVERMRVKDSFTHVWWMAPSERPKADNRRVLKKYSASMLRLIETQKYNAGRRPSEHHIGETSFLKNNNGAIPPNVLTYANTAANDDYLEYCRKHEIPHHPARMNRGLAEFFINFLTTKKNLVLDPFGGSNVTGSEAERLKRRWVSIEPCEQYLVGSIGRFQFLGETVGINNGDINLQVTPMSNEDPQVALTSQGDGNP